MTERTWNLRSERSFRVIERALFATSNLERSRIVHFSVQGNQIHMLVEAADRLALSSCMRSLGIRIGRGLNAMMHGHGRVIAHRYHARSLRTPTEVYRALGYVRDNAAVHAARRGARSNWAWVDRFSSDAELSFTPPAATTWLLDVGWRRALRAAPTCRAKGLSTGDVGS
jgi:REP element-mobilizing transposase RayT